MFSCTYKTNSRENIIKTYRKKDQNTSKLYISIGNILTNIEEATASNRTNLKYIFLIVYTLGN